MPLILPQGSPQSDQLAIHLPDSGQVLDRFESYSFDEDYTTPCSGFHFVIGGKSNPPDAVVASLVPGAKVELHVNGVVQGAGYIDDNVPRAGHSGGMRRTITGRNTFAPVVGGGADPFDVTLHFAPHDTLEKLVTTVFGRYGFIAFAIDDAEDRSIRTGLQNQRFSKKKGKPLKRFTYGQQLKPQPGEGSYEFVAKIVNRAGFFVRCAADGKTVIVDTPDYDQAPICRIVRHVGDNVSNVIEGGIGCHTEHQPSVIVATGFAGGGEWPRSSLKVAMINELVGLTGPLGPKQLPGSNYADGVGRIINANVDAKVIEPRNVFAASSYRPLQFPRPLFLHDQDAKSQTQLENFVRLEMSRFQQHMWSGEYLMRGHTYFDGIARIPWTVNTIADVDDQDSGPVRGQSFIGPMWIKSRTFEKSRAGAFTRLRVTMPRTLDLFALDATT